MNKIKYLLLSGTSLLAAEATREQWAISGIVPSGVISTITGDDRVAVTALGFQFAVSAALGRPFANISAMKQKTLFVTYEQSISCLRHWLKELKHDENPSDDNPFDLSVLQINGDAMNCRCAQGVSQAENFHFWSELEFAAACEKPDMMVIDLAACASLLGQEDYVALGMRLRNLMRQGVVKTVVILNAGFDETFVTKHCLGSAQEMNLKYPAKSKVGFERNCGELHILSSMAGVPDFPFRLTFGNGLLVEMVDEPGAREELFFEELSARIVDTVGRLTDNGLRLSASPSSRHFAAKILGKLFARYDITEDMIEGELYRLIENGELIQSPTGEGRNFKEELKVRQG